MNPAGRVRCDIMPIGKDYSREPDVRLGTENSGLVHLYRG
jgi:hypothetical protein